MSGNDVMTGNDDVKTGNDDVMFANDWQLHVWQSRVEIEHYSVEFFTSLP